MNWKQTDDDTRVHFQAWVEKSVVARMDLGRENYGATYQGSPLKEASEELLDGLFAVFMLERREQALAQAIQDIKDKRVEYWAHHDASPMGSSERAYFQGYEQALLWVLGQIKEMDVSKESQDEEDGSATGGLRGTTINERGHDSAVDEGADPRSTQAHTGEGGEGVRGAASHLRYMKFANIVQDFPESCDALKAMLCWLSMNSWVGVERSDRSVIGYFETPDRLYPTCLVLLTETYWEAKKLLEEQA